MRCSATVLGFVSGERDGVKPRRRIMAIIGHATSRSATAIARVYVDTWRSAYAGLLPNRVLTSMSYERQTSEWSWQIRNRADGQAVIVAAEVGHGVVGVASLGPSRPQDRPLGDGEDGRVGEVYTLYVLPEFQDRGIGRQLLAGAFSALIAREIDRCCVWSLRENPSRFFYERMGGKPVAERKQRLWGTDLPQIAYGWDDLKATVERLTARQVE